MRTRAALLVPLLFAGFRGPLHQAAPATLHVVHLSANRFTPAEIAVRPGDTVRFVLDTGGPHNVQFVADSLSESARRLLEDAMPGEKLGPIAGPLLLEHEVYQFRVPELPPGRYPYVCLPHAAGNMRGALLVVPSRERGTEDLR